MLLANEYESKYNHLIKRNLNVETFLLAMAWYLGMSISEIQLIVSAIFKIIWF